MSWTSDLKMHQIAQAWIVVPLWVKLRELYYRSCLSLGFGITLKLT